MSAHSWAWKGRALSANGIRCAQIPPNLREPNLEGFDFGGAASLGILVEHAGAARFAARWLTANRTVAQRRGRCAPTGTARLAT